VRGIDPQCPDHLPDGMLAPDSLIFLDYFCNRLC
jgi:hypothetical protein